MGRKHHTEEQIIGISRAAEVVLSQERRAVSGLRVDNQILKEVAQGYF